MSSKGGDWRAPGVEGPVSREGELADGEVHLLDLLVRRLPACGGGGGDGQDAKANGIMEMNRIAPLPNVPYLHLDTRTPENLGGATGATNDEPYDQPPWQAGSARGGSSPAASSR